jgi:transcriptional regulator with XRE-family HTH domain
MGSPTIHDPAMRHVLGQNLRAELNKREWSESELARRSGVSQKQINNIVRERNGCSVEGLAYIARTMSLPVWWLVTFAASSSEALPQRADAVLASYMSCTDAERSAIDRLVEGIERRQRANR